VDELRVEALKQVNLVDFLSEHYGLEFQRQGVAYACCSPFTGESTPSFFVRLVNGHWLFKDFSSGAGGSIFDFVQIKETLGRFSDALAFLRRLLGPSAFRMGQGDRAAGTPADGEGVSGADRPYDVDHLYGRFRQEDPDVCRQYLLRRKIDPDLVEALIRDGTVVHNRHDGRSYCCFAVRDATGSLRCLDNHAVEGSGKFVLGSKNPFSCEWEALKRAKQVFVSEGIIDYLSVKSLESAPPPGLALLGNQLCFDPSLLASARLIQAAVDDDRGGTSAALDLQEMYPETEVRLYDLEDHQDPNELLVAVRSGAGRKLNPTRKLQLYREFQQTRNRAELARHWGIDRSYLYEIVQECERTLLDSFAGRKPGRPPKGKPASLEEAWKRIEELEAAYEQKATEQEKQYCRSEFLEIRLKYAEIEAAELRGETVMETGPAKKPQIKKKRRKRRSKSSSS
jgi:DNA primase